MVKVMKRIYDHKEKKKEVVNLSWFGCRTWLQKCT